MTDLGEKLDLSTVLLEKCEMGLCCIFNESNATSLNEVRYRKLLKVACAHEIPPTHDAQALISAEQTINMTYGKMLRMPNCPVDNPRSSTKSPAMDGKLQNPKKCDT